MMEIERKFLVRECPPNLRDSPVTHILQGYLAITEEGSEIRLRKRDDVQTLTVKTGRGLKRSEFEITITHDQFDELWPATEGRRVEKKRYMIDVEAHHIELDVYEGALSDLLTAEVEFKSVQESRGFTPPPWLDREITEDERYKNRNLAVHGIPELPS